MIEAMLKNYCMKPFYLLLLYFNFIFIYIIHNYLTRSLHFKLNARKCQTSLSNLDFISSELYYLRINEYVVIFWIWIRGVTPIIFNKILVNSKYSLVWHHMIGSEIRTLLFCSRKHNPLNEYIYLFIKWDCRIFRFGL